MSQMKLFKNVSGIIIMSTGNTGDGFHALGVVIVADEDSFYQKGDDIQFFPSEWKQLNVTYIPRNYNLDDHIAILNMPDKFLKWIDDIFETPEFKAVVAGYNIDLDGEYGGQLRKKILTSFFLPIIIEKRGNNKKFSCKFTLDGTLKTFYMLEVYNESE